MRAGRHAAAAFAALGLALAGAGGCATNPATGEAVRFEAPPAEDLARVLADLREAAREGGPADDPPPGRPRLA